jgi:hypothetical protein
MLLLFVPEFAPQQLTGFVGDLSQPLFERLFLLAIDLPVPRFAGSAGRLIAVGSCARSLLVGRGFLIAGRAVGIGILRR